MKKPQEIQIKRLCFFLLALVAITLPFPLIHINSVCIALAFCCALFYFFAFERRKIWKNPYFLLFSALYGMHYVGFWNSEDNAAVSFDIEQKLALFAFPLIFATAPYLGKHRYIQLIKFFIYALLAVCLLTFRNGFYWGYTNPELYDSLLIRRPYLGMYCAMAVLFCISIVEREHRSVQKILYGAMGLFFAFFLSALFAKMAIVVFCVTLTVYIIGSFLIRKAYKATALMMISLIITVSYFAFVNESGHRVVKKFISLEEFDRDNYDPRTVNSLNLRFIYWRCATQVLAKKYYWLSGVGTGEAQPALEICYADKEGKNSFIIREHHDPHNQYFITWLSLGLIPFLLLLFHFFFLLCRYVQQKSLLAFAFTLGIMLFCVTESIFENQKGIVFYALFQSIFMFGNLGKNDQN